MDTQQRATSDDFRTYLQTVLLERCRANPRYSLRAFARQLQLEPSYLSKILSGKRNPTESLVLRLAGTLALDPNRAQAFIEKARRSKSRRRSGKPASEWPFHHLTLDTFHVISDWYHYAILELLTVDGFEHEPRWIARTLGITVDEARAALERLERVGMIERGDDGKWANRPANHSTVGNPFTAGAFRNLQKQILTQALEALEHLPMDQRDQSSMTMAIDPESIPAARERIRSFRRELCSFLQADGVRRKQVYQLSISLFPAGHPLASQP